jgi:hypothetical protein
MSDRSQIVTFFLTSSEPRAWVVINNAEHESRVIEMWKGYPNHWSVSAWLIPGDYHCRYYCGDDHEVTYHGPARTTGSTNVGMEGLVSVALPRGEMNSYSTNILIVEDNRTTLLALENALRNDGYIVHAAEGYQTALEIATPPDAFNFRMGRLAIRLLG